MFTVVESTGMFSARPWYRDRVLAVYKDDIVRGGGVSVTHCQYIPYING